jgi:integrase
LRSARFIRGQPSVFEPFTLHEARHSFSTWMDHAGISEARCDRYMGHARGGVAGRNRQLLPAQIAEDAAKLDAYLTGASVGKVGRLAAAQ